MKKWLFTFAVMVLGAFVSMAQGIDGKWKASMEGPNGKMELTYTFKVDGAALTGSISSEMGDLAISNGKVNGKEFSFDLDFNGNAMPFKGAIDGDVIKLSMTGGPNGQTESVLTRAGAAAGAGVAAAGKGVDGKWKTSFSGGPGGDGQAMEIIFTFKADGEKLSGSVNTPMGDMQFTNGKIVGKELSFDVDMNGMAIKHKGTLDGDAINLTVDGIGGPDGGQGGSSAMVLKRAL